MAAVRSQLRKANYDLSETTVRAPSEGYVVANTLRPGQSVEVTLKLYPGRILTGTVEKIAWVTPQGQLAPSGNAPVAPTADQSATPFGVVLQLDEDESVDISSLPGGAVGSAAIYTNRVQATHLIRRVMIRMDAWMNYITPW